MGGRSKVPCNLGKPWHFTRENLGKRPMTWNWMKGHLHSHQLRPLSWKGNQRIHHGNKYDTLPETNTSPLQIGHPKRKRESIATIHFQVRTVSFREGRTFQRRQYTPFFWNRGNMAQYIISATLVLGCFSKFPHP